MNPVRRYMALGLLVSAGLLAQGCTSTVSKGISDDGKQASEVIFPDAAKSHVKEGTLPALEHFHKVRPGISKDQLYAMFGVPHFSEGIAGVREWDYVFQLQGSKDKEPTQCQFKIIFDKNNKGQSFYWSPKDCAQTVGM